MNNVIQRGGLTKKDNIEWCHKNWWNYTIWEHEKVFLNASWVLSKHIYKEQGRISDCFKVKFGDKHTQLVSPWWMWTKDFINNFIQRGGLTKKDDIEWCHKNWWNYAIWEHEIGRISDSFKVKFGDKHTQLVSPWWMWTLFILFHLN